MSLWSLYRLFKSTYINIFFIEISTVYALKTPIKIDFLVTAVLFCIYRYMFSCTTTNVRFITQKLKSKQNPVEKLDITGKLIAYLLLFFYGENENKRNRACYRQEIIFYVLPKLYGQSWSYTATSNAVIYATRDIQREESRTVE